MSIPDSVVGMYARLCAALPPREVDEIEAEVAAGGVAANQAKRRMAREVVALYHGPSAAPAAEERFDAVFQRGEVPADLPEHRRCRRRPGPPAGRAGRGRAGRQHQRRPARHRRRRGADRRRAGRRRGTTTWPAPSWSGTVLTVGKRRGVAARLSRRPDTAVERLANLTRPDRPLSTADLTRAFGR